MGSVKVGSARWGGGQEGSVGSVKVGSARWGVGQEGSGGVSEGRVSAVGGGPGGVRWGQ